jgi:hypothetical protein
MTEVLDSGHVITDEDVDTAQLIMELDRTLGRPTDSRTHRVAATPPHQVQSVLGAMPTTNGHAVPAGSWNPCTGKTTRVGSVTAGGAAAAGAADTTASMRAMPVP